MALGLSDSSLASTLEYGINGGIMILAAFLASISWIAYSRNREQKLLYMASAFSLFALKGALIVIEPLLISMGYAYQAELIEHSAPALTLIALILFFVTLTRE